MAVVCARLQTFKFRPGTTTYIDHTDICSVQESGPRHAAQQLIIWSLRQPCIKPKLLKYYMEDSISEHIQLGQNITVPR